MRAILLAAGMGTRLRPLTLEVPKSLIKINGQPMIERQIEFLKDKGIDDILVVTGYLREEFDYLEEKYSIKLIHNDMYNKYNNIYTMYLAKEYLGNSYVIDADVYLHENFIDSSIEKSTYFSGYKSGFKNEWIIEFDRENKIYDIKVGNGEGYILSGVSYWNQEDAKVIIEKLDNIIKYENFDNLYWDNVVKDNLNSLDVRIKMIDSNACFEIDCIEDLKYVEEYIEVELSNTINKQT